MYVCVCVWGGGGGGGGGRNGSEWEKGSGVGAGGNTWGNKERKDCRRWRKNDMEAEGESEGKLTLSSASSQRDVFHIELYFKCLHKG